MKHLPIRPWMRRDGLREIFSAFDSRLGPDSIRFVGGCVRDGIRGDSVGDIDLAVRCPPEELMEILGSRADFRTHGFGLNHGVVAVAFGNERYEVASLRKDVATDGRHARIAYTDSWSQDAHRRDFRCNALYAAADGSLFDPTGGGLDDIRQGKVVFVGDPVTRIREDYLRILRFFRFSARYAHRIDSTGLAACADLRKGLEQISTERIWSEIRALLVARSADLAVQAMLDSLVLEQILPDHAPGDVFAAMAEADRTAGLDPDAVLRLAALVPPASDFAGLAVRFRMSLQQSDALAAAAGTLDATDTASLSRLVYRIGADAALARLRLHWARTGQVQPDVSLVEHIGTWRCPRFPLGGRDAMEAGLTGAGIGIALRQIEDEWIALDFLPTRDQLVRRLSVLVQSQKEHLSDPSSSR